MAERALTDLQLERVLAGDKDLDPRATAADRARLDELRAANASYLAALDVDAEAHAGGSGGDQRRIDSMHDLVFLTRGLSEEEMTVAVLHHLDGYTQEGIAESLDLSRRTVGKMLAKFEEHLKKRAARTGFIAAKAANDG